MAAPRPLIGHPSAVLSSHWPAVSPLPGHHWPVNIGFLLQGAAAAPLCSSLGAGCCDSLLSVCCVGCAHGDQHHRHHRDHGDPGLQTQPRPRSQCQQIHSEPDRRSESGVYSNSSLTSWLQGKPLLKIYPCVSNREHNFLFLFSYRDNSPLRFPFHRSIFILTSAGADCHFKFS